MTFKIGDVVRLKSGGPLMTLSYIKSSESVGCVWFNQETHAYEPKYFDFKAEMLKSVDLK
ncbi:YodC family protein [Neorhizobium galegae]|uniref:YodC family protein n=1 Tax=Neorhizobium galegae TaxID=399 RepID=UPI0006223B7F|nr:DUF2158 domain-containing protein [Neorhizobium galegae]CDZ50405.1 Hypothetical protein NGAL_HAMBI2427_36230 [Neorhizobium galegae bv. orientalis]